MRSSRSLVVGISVVCFLFILPFFHRAIAGSVTLAWEPSPDPAVYGYTLRYGLVSQLYTAAMSVTNGASVTVDGLAPGVVYYFSVNAYNRKGIPGAASSELAVQVPFPPSILLQPSSQIAQAGADIFLVVDAIGTPPLTFQWLRGAAPIFGATNPVLALSDVSDADAGDYTVVVISPLASITSIPATVTVLDPPSGAGGQNGDVELQAGTNSGLSAADLAAKIGRQALFANAAGIYNGLFFETDNQGWPAMTPTTTGFISNCVLDAYGDFQGSVYIAGVSNLLFGSLNSSGDGTSVISGAASGLPDLQVSLRLDTSGAPTLTGVVSNTDAADPWSAPLTAVLQTNSIGSLPSFLLALETDQGFSGGLVTGEQAGGSLSLFGLLADGGTFYQNAPVSVTGDIPLFASLENGAGFVAGWINVLGDPLTSFLTWVHPSGTLGASDITEFETTISYDFDGTFDSVTEDE